MEHAPARPHCVALHDAGLVACGGLAPAMCMVTSAGL